MSSRPLNNNRGQIVLEYILLMLVAITIAVLITKQLVGRNPDNPGVVIQKWSQITQVIGADQSD